MSDKKTAKTKFVFTLMVVQTIIVLVFLLLNPSEPENTVFIRYSLPKLILIAIPLLILFSLLTILLMRLFARKLFHKPLSFVKCIFEKGFGSYLLLGLMTGSTYISILSGLAVSSRWVTVSKYRIIYQFITNGLPLFILLALLNIEFFILFTFFWQWKLNLPNLSKALQNLYKTRSFRAFWLVSIIVTSSIHWYMLIFHWNILEKIPYWYWPAITKNNINFWLIVPITASVFAGFWIVSTKKLSKRMKILLFLVIGYLFMIGFAAFEGSPYQVLYEKRYISGHRNYIAVLARNDVGSDFLVNYENAFSHDRFFATKPPGVYLLYRGLLLVSGLIFPTNNYQEKYDAINHTIMLLFPLISLLTAIIIEKLTSQFTQIEHSLKPTLLLFLTPNFMLMVGTIDQAIIPLLFSAGILLGIRALKNQSWWKSVFFGCYVYLILFFSFSLLPMLLMFALWAVLELLRGWETIRIHNHLKFALGFAIGFLLLSVIFLILFNYSPLVRYRNAMFIHEIQRVLPNDIKAYLKMYLLNNIEFATWIGLPLALTLVFSVFSSVINFVYGKWNTLDSLVVAFAGTYFFVNHFGNTLSEVGRLWLFFVPFISVFAIGFINFYLNKSKYILMMAILQLITIFQIVQHLRITWE